MDQGDSNKMSDEKKNSGDVTKSEVAVYEALVNNKQLATTEDKKVPLSMVFGHGTLGNLESFGGKTLLENSQEVDKALANTGELENIWNHSHTQWTWRHINLSWHSPMKNMRQLSAEVSSKKGALNSAKWNQIKNEIKIRKIQERLEKGNEDGSLDYWKEVELKVKLMQLQEGMAEGSRYIQGAMKDVLALNEMYEQLKESVNSFSEYDMEMEESKSHLKRSLVQCIRDVRQGGSISKGEQEYMEQIGVNPMKIQKAIRIYVASEEEDEGWDVSSLYSFVDNMTNELIDYYKVDKKVMELRGLNDDTFEHSSYINKLALPKNTSEE
jgi:hypothetical protein